ncbi:MAG: hypothetical protein ACJ76N_26160, partial [Thermoanaerobaculia bacterium]
QDVRLEKGVQYGDLIQYMDWPLVVEVAALDQLLLGELAAAPAPPKAAALSGAVTPSAKITIEAEDDPERQGFELLQRETTDARWHVLRTVDRPGQAVLENTSTDNEYFAVRSVGKNGRRSFAVPCVAAPAQPAPAPAKPPGR